MEHIPRLCGYVGQRDAFAGTRSAPDENTQALPLYMCCELWQPQNDGWPPFRIVLCEKALEAEARTKTEKCVNASHVERVTFDLHLQTPKNK